MKVCIIGAGVLGLVAAVEVSARGHDVVILDREGVFAGASHRSFAWLNGNHKFPSSYHRLNAQGIADHERLQAQAGLDRTWLHLTGNILVDFSDAQDKTYAERLAFAEAEGYPVAVLSREELDRLEPGVTWPKELERGLFYPREGYLDNDILAEELLRHLEARGVTVDVAEVKSIQSSANAATVVLTDGEERAFDQVVLAAGADSRLIGEASGYVIPVADLNHPSNRTHSLLGLTAPVEDPVRHVFISDRLNARPRHDGRMWVQVPALESRVNEGESRELLTEASTIMEQALADILGQRAPVEKVFFSGRSFPEDGLSIIGYVDDHERVYTTVTHSGMTLAALFGRLVAEELEGDADEELLADFRPTRFADGVVVPQDFNFIGKQ